MGNKEIIHLFGPTWATFSFVTAASLPSQCMLVQHGVLTRQAVQPNVVHRYLQMQCLPCACHAPEDQGRTEFIRVISVVVKQRCCAFPGVESQLRCLHSRSV